MITIFVRFVKISHLNRNRILLFLSVRLCNDSMESRTIVAGVAWCRSRGVERTPTSFLLPSHSPNSVKENHAVGGLTGSMVVEPLY